LKFEAHLRPDLDGTLLTVDALMAQTRLQGQSKDNVRRW
jgi:hypothetical protein